MNLNILSNEDIIINGFSTNPFRADKSVNYRNGGVCLYFKESLPIKERPDLELIPETIVAELEIKRKNIFIVLSYCQPNLSTEEFDNYLFTLENIYKCIRKEKQL